MRSTRRHRTAHVPNASLSFGEVGRSILRPRSLASAEREAAPRVGVSEVVLFRSARGALSACVRALTEGEDVAVPAYTCAAVVNAVLTAAKTPVFVDVDGRGLVPQDAWPSGALPLVQDTYGFAAPAAGGVFVRDSAHRAYPLALGGAAVVVTSFEHSKSLSAGRGGLAATDDASLAQLLRRLRDETNPRPRRLRQSATTAATLAMGRLDASGRRGAGELFRKVAWHLDVTRLLGQSGAETTGAGVDPALLGPPDGAQAALMLSQLARAVGIAAHRAAVVRRYDAGAGIERSPVPLVRYPLRADDPVAFERALAAVGWDVRGRWFASPLHGARDVAAFGYRPGSAPVAERLAATTVNLPTHPLVGLVDADRLIEAASAAGAEPLT